MKPNITIIYNVILAITSVLLLYSYFYVLVYDKDFFDEEASKKEIVAPETDTTNNNTLDTSRTDSSADTIKLSSATSMESDTIADSSAALSKNSLKPTLPSTTDKASTPKGIKGLDEKPTEPVNFLDMLVVMFLAGMLGGVLANLRGIFEFYREEKGFPDHLFIPYLIRPLTASISGLLIFFISHLIISSTANPTYDNEYISFRGMVSFMSLAIISGFASQEFTERLKAAAGTLFGISPTVSTETDKPSSLPLSEETDPDHAVNTSETDHSLDSDNNTTINPEASENIPPLENTPKQSPLTPQSQQKIGKSRYMNRD